MWVRTDRGGPRYKSTDDDTPDLAGGTYTSGWVRVTCSRESTPGKCRIHLQGTADIGIAGYA